MGVIFDCIICGDQAGEFEEIDGEPVCDRCKNKAIRIGINVLINTKGRENDK